MNKRGGLLVPFALILSLFALLVGALAGNVIGRKNTVEGKIGILDTQVPTVPRQQEQHYPDYGVPTPANPVDTQTQK